MMLLSLAVVDGAPHHSPRNAPTTVDDPHQPPLHSAWIVLAHRPPSRFEASFVQPLPRAADVAYPCAAHSDT